MMLARGLWAFAALGLAVLLPAPASAERTSIQEVPCEPGQELLLARDGTISACRIGAPAELQVAPTGGNAIITCSAGSSVEFHRNGYLSFCASTAAAGNYVTRSRAPTRCDSGSRVAFDENGYLEYCSRAMRAPADG